ncbi:MAG: hypothetical protein VX777_09455 [Chlamydiota bacterium]|nr:hypothetical protein [Chlamydiota bacterium]
MFVDDVGRFNEILDLWEIIPPIPSSTCLSRKWSNLTGTVNKCLEKGVDFWKHNCVVQAFRRYSDLMVDCVILSVDTVFLVGSLFPELIPATVTSLSYTSLEYIGLLGLIFTGSLLTKVTGDVFFAKKMRNWKILAESIFKVSYLILGVSLTLSGCAAGTARLMGYQEVTNAIYKYTRPASEVSIVSGFLFMVYYYITNKKIIGYLEEGIDEEQLVEMVHHFRNEAIDSSSEGTWRAADIRARMDKDTWWDFEEKIKDLLESDNENFEQVFNEVCLKNIQTQQLYVKSTFCLRIAGDLGFALSSWYPGTVIQAGIDEVFSLLYTSLLAYKKYAQYQERRSLPQTLPV